MTCTHVPTCELHPQFAFNSALKVWQVHYCEGEYARCARYQLALSGQPIPLNLLPNGKLIEAPRAGAEYGATAMFNAILKHRLPMVVSLVRAGVNVNSQNGEGTTPLMAAASIGSTEIVRLLLERGADPAITNLTGDTAHDIAVRAGHRELADMLGRHRSGSHASSASRGLWSRLFTQR